MESEPPSPKAEFLMTIAGPLASLFLAGIFWMLCQLLQILALGQALYAVLAYVMFLNLGLAIFNMIPAFPLDGGRILRGVAWGLTGNFTRATKIASTVGKIFAYLMIIAGVYRAMTGDWVGGIWTAFIGWFLLSAAQESFMQVAMRNTLTDVRAADLMTNDIPTVTRDMSIEEYVHEVLRTGRRVHIVTGPVGPVGLITLHAARLVPREDWTNNSIQAVMLPLDRIHSASPAEPALGVLQRMQSQDINQMPVISEGNIVGMIARDTILRMLQTRLQLGHRAEQ